MRILEGFIKKFLKPGVSTGLYPNVFFFEKAIPGEILSQKFEDFLRNIKGFPSEFQKYFQKLFQKFLRFSSRSFRYYSIFFKYVQEYLKIHIENSHKITLQLSLGTLLIDPSGILPGIALDIFRLSGIFFTKLFLMILAEIIKFSRIFPMNTCRGFFSISKTISILFSSVVP